ncbi:MAG: hypothetical protein DRP85_08805 [Candidatus Makaraimicrobium thalassicum]|nr:MAG: hypothetical protein DRP85_08805 [Candidatus Omnitrophota bacterium]
MKNKRLTLTPHYTTEELKARYLTCEHPVERSHWQIIWLMSRKDKNYSCSQVADLMGCTSDWVRKLVRRYNEEAEDGLRDKRRDNGNAPILDDALQDELIMALESEPPDHGLWTGPKVASWMSKKLGRKIHATTGWRWLVQLGWSAKVPRRQHAKSATEEEQAAFKKNSKIM